MKTHELIQTERIESLLENFGFYKNLNIFATKMLKLFILLETENCVC